MDAAHTQRTTAEHIKAGLDLDYIMTVKGNQPTLYNEVLTQFTPLVSTVPGYVTEERDHGRITRWSTWMTGTTGIDFPHAAQLGCTRRDEFTLDEKAISKEFAFIITSSPAGRTGPVGLHTHVREHWEIENKSHHVRDVVYREDHQHTWDGNGAHTMAALRNLVLGLFRLNGIHKIREAAEAVCRDRLRTLPLLAT